MDLTNRGPRDGWVREAVGRISWKSSVPSRNCFSPRSSPQRYQHIVDIVVVVCDHQHERPGSQLRKRPR